MIIMVMMIIIIIIVILFLLIIIIINIIIFIVIIIIIIIIVVVIIVITIAIGMTICIIIVVFIAIVIVVLNSLFRLITLFESQDQVYIYKKIHTSNSSDANSSFSSFTWTARSSVVCRSHTEAKRRPSRKRQRNRCYIRFGDVVDCFEDVWFMVRFLLDQVMSGYFGAIRNNRGP